MSMPLDDLDTARSLIQDDGPRYEAIARLLLEGMADGRYPVGSLLPTEARLAQAFDVSRQTIRAAMRQLSDLGAISRRQGVGTTVEPRHSHAGGYQQSLGSLDDLMRYAQETRRSIGQIDHVVVDRKQAALYGCKPGSRWLRIVYIRTPIKEGAQAVGYTEVYVDERFAGIEPRLKDHASLYSDLIETLYGVTIEEIQQEVRAEAVAGPACTALGVEPGSAVLNVLRKYLDRSGALIEFTISIHPMGRYVVKSNLKKIRENS